MTRIELDGKGLPIPTEALPEGIVADGALAPVVYVLEEGTFEKQDFVGLGYTHYEVYCIGAAGGQGGSLQNPFGVHSVRWVYYKTMEVMPSDLWYTYLTHHTIYTHDPNRIYSYDDAFGNHLLNFIELSDYLNPTKTVEVTHYVEPYWLDNNFDRGGGGGGGGLHKVTGLLADLDDEVEVVIGSVGADAGPGQDQFNGGWLPPYVPTYDQYPAPMSDPYLVYGWFTNRYPDPIPLLYPPEDGGDGGASSFGDVAKASGGKGGKPAAEWVGGVLTARGYGGEGGLGDTEVAGGGGDGSTSTSSGQDGPWSGSIGGGGGGGRGGKMVQSGGGISGSPYVQTITREASHGGQGSFSFGDTTVFGTRGFRSNYVTYFRTYSSATGEVTAQSPTSSNVPVVPGGGGGAKTPGSNKYGSKATGFSPNGAVILRVYKVE